MTEERKDEATIADNIRSMAELVKSVKRASQLNESTVMRIVELSFALADRDRAAAQQAAYQNTPFNDDDGNLPLPDDIPQIPLAEEGDENVLAAATPLPEEE